MGDGAEFNPALLVLFVVIVLAVALQNWWLRRRAEGKPIIPDRLRRLLGGGRR